jgi:microcystin synthetase protein McyJ
MTHLAEDLLEEHKTPGTWVMDHYHQHLLNLDHPLWLNLGYWRDERSYSGACAALADKVLELSGVEEIHDLLDAGCGFGEPAQRWLRSGKVKRITALNTDAFQVEVASARIEDAGLQDRCRVLHQGAETFEDLDITYDVVIALESAFHFNTRAEFFANAARLLRPGGVLVTADMIPTESWTSTARNREVRQWAHIPEANVCTMNQYARQVQDAGFEEVSVRSIRKEVYPGMAVLVDNLQRGANLEDPVEIPDSLLKECIGASLWEDFTGFGDFILCRAVRKEND